MFLKILKFIREIISYPTILIIIAVGLFTFFYDGEIYKQKGFIRELKMIRIISYSYMGIGALMFILLLLM